MLLVALASHLFEIHVEIYFCIMYKLFNFEDLHCLCEVFLRNTQKNTKNTKVFLKTTKLRYLVLKYIQTVEQSN